MSGYDLRDILDVKCIPCCYFSGCKIREGFIVITDNFKQNQVSEATVNKILNCMYFRRLVE